MGRKKYVFGYGSLVNVDDVYRTLGRRVEFIYPVELSGWIRDWSVVIDATASHRSRGLARDSKAPGHIVVLNVRQPGVDELSTNPNGVLFEVDDIDLQKIDCRETHYRRHDVTSDIADAPGIVYTYTGLEQFLDSQNPGLVPVIPGPYLEIVTNGFQTLAPDAYTRYISSTQPSKLPIFHPASPVFMD